jgi:AcrR family transcriptional regulator
MGKATRKSRAKWISAKTILASSTLSPTHPISLLTHHPFIPTNRPAGLHTVWMVGISSHSCARLEVNMINRSEAVRDDILNAAEQVVAKLGTAHLTLDAVADRAKRSKGGLLYHFPTKEALLRAMLARVLEHCDGDRKTARANEVAADDPAGDLKAFICAAFKDPTERRSVSCALLAAGANNPALLAPVRAWHEQLFQEFAPGKRYPFRVMALMLALDGMWLGEVLNTSCLSSEDKLRLKEELFALADATV